MNDDKPFYIAISPTGNAWPCSAASVPEEYLDGDGWRIVSYHDSYDELLATTAQMRDACIETMP